MVALPEKREGDLYLLLSLKLSPEMWINILNEGWKKGEPIVSSKEDSWFNL
jgi:hypothetical protein